MKLSLETSLIKKITTVFFATLIVFLFATVPLVEHAYAFPKKELVYKGRLANSAGNSVSDGSYNISFSIYKDPSGGSAIWTESQNAEVKNGIFSAVLGLINPINIDFNDDNAIYYIGIKVGSDAEMSPRQTIGAAPFALNSLKLDGASAGTGANNVLKLGSTGEISIGGNITTSGKLQAGNSTLSNLLVKNGSILEGGLTVTDNAEFQAPTTFVSTISVVGDATLNSGLNVSGNATIGGSLGVNGDLTAPNVVYSVNGTAGRISSTGGQNPTIDIASNYAGQTSISTLGTVTTGVWNGAPISNAYVAILNGGAQGDIIYRNAVGWVRLAAGTDGQFLETHGPSANPRWADVTGGSGSSNIDDGTVNNSTLRWDSSLSKWVEDTNLLVNPAGTIVAGTWNGSEITDAYISDNITASNYLRLTGGTMLGDLDMNWNDILHVGNLSGNTIDVTDVYADNTHTDYISSNNNTDVTYNSDIDMNYNDIKNVNNLSGNTSTFNDSYVTNQYVDNVYNNRNSEINYYSNIDMNDYDIINVHNISGDTSNFYDSYSTNTYTDNLYSNNNTEILVHNDIDMSNHSIYNVDNLDVQKLYVDEIYPTTVIGFNGDLNMKGYDIYNVDQITATTFTDGIATISSGTINGATWHGNQISDNYVSALNGGIQGDILYFNGANWTKLHAGTSGQYLRTNGAGANPSWAATSSGGSMPGGTTNGSIATYDTSSGSWNENTNFIINNAGTVTSGTWHGSSIDISSYTNLAVSSPITLTGDTIGLSYNATNLKLTAGALNTIQDIAVASSPTFTGITSNGNLRIRDASATYYSVFQTTTQSRNVTYTLPSDYPAGNGYALTSTSAGSLSWVNGTTLGNNLWSDGGTYLYPTGWNKSVKVGADATHGMDVSYAGGVTDFTSSNSSAVHFEGVPVVINSAPTTIQTVKAQLLLEDNATAYGSNPVAGIYMAGNTGSGGIQGWGGITVGKENSTENNWASYMALFTRGGGGGDDIAERVRIDSNGYVGIGTTSPNEALTVNSKLSLQETTSPTLTANYGKVYVKASDSKLYFMNDSGTEFDLTAAASGALWTRSAGALFPTMGEWVNVTSANQTQFNAYDTRSQAAGVGGGLAFYGKTADSGAYASEASIYAAKQNSISGDNRADLVFGITSYSYTAPAEKMRISAYRDDSTTLSFANVDKYNEGNGVHIANSISIDSAKPDNAIGQLALYDTESMIQGDGGKISFYGKYDTLGRYSQGGAIQMSKQNGLSDNQRYDYVLTMNTGVGSQEERFRITPTSNSTLVHYGVVSNQSDYGVVYDNTSNFYQASHSSVNVYTFSYGQVNLFDTNPVAEGNGAALTLFSKYNNAGDYLESGYLRSFKENSTSGDQYYDLVLGTSGASNGGGGTGERMRIIPGVGNTTLYFANVDGDGGVRYTQQQNIYTDGNPLSGHTDGAQLKLYDTRSSASDVGAQIAFYGKDSGDNFKKGAWIGTSKQTSGGDNRFDFVVNTAAGITAKLGYDGANNGFGLASYSGGTADGHFTWLRTGSQTANITYILPTAQGAAGTFLKNDGSGNLTWDTLGSSSHILQFESPGSVTEFTEIPGSSGYDYCALSGMDDDNPDHITGIYECKVQYEDNKWEYVSPVISTLVNCAFTCIKF